MIGLFYDAFIMNGYGMFYMTNTSKMRLTEAILASQVVTQDLALVSETARGAVVSE